MEIGVKVPRILNLYSRWGEWPDSRSSRTVAGNLQVGCVCPRAHVGMVVIKTAPPGNRTPAMEP